MVILDCLSLRLSLLPLLKKYFFWSDIVAVDEDQSTNPGIIVLVNEHIFWFFSLSTLLRHCNDFHIVLYYTKTAIRKHTIVL